MSAHTHRPAPAYLMLEGIEVGGPDGPGYRAAVDAISAVGETLRSNLQRLGLPQDHFGALKKQVTRHREESAWHWKLMLRVPGNISASLLELAKHLTRTSQPIVVMRRDRVRPVRPRRVAMAA